MRIHVLQHVPFEGLGAIFPWAKARKASITSTQFFESVMLPHQSQFDMLIVLGGPMSVNDEDELPWLQDEKQFVRSAIELGKPVLGICLGAQLMAASLGSRVYPAEHKEIGWFPIFACASPPKNTQEHFNFPQQMDVFHWHGETFDLPAGAVHLARSQGCSHQAFQIGRRAIGLQFHLEMTAHSVDDILLYCGDELRPERFIQSAAELSDVPTSRYAPGNALMVELLDYLNRTQCVGC